MVKRDNENLVNFWKTFDFAEFKIIIKKTSSLVGTIFMSSWHNNLSLFTLLFYYFWIIAINFLPPFA